MSIICIHRCVVLNEYMRNPIQKQPFNIVDLSKALTVLERV